MIICYFNLNDLCWYCLVGSWSCENFIKVRDVLFLFVDIDGKEFFFGIWVEVLLLYKVVKIINILDINFIV